MDLTSAIQSFNTYPNLTLCNTDVQTCKVNSLQQPLHIPWDNSDATEFSSPFLVVPGINQLPLSNVIPTQNPLILLPIPSVHSPTSQPSLCTTVLPVSNPAIENEPALDSKSREARALNNCSVPIAMKSCTPPLPILSQPALHHSQRQQSFTSTGNTIIQKSLSSFPSKAIKGENNSCDGDVILKERNDMVKNLPKHLPCSLSSGGGERIGPVTTFSTYSNPKKTNSSAIQHSPCNEQLKNCMKRESECAGQINYDNISKIISSLPPGWKVVGLTSLENTGTNAPLTFESHPVPSNAIPIIQSQGLNVNSNSTPPDVVSVDLNVSSAMTILSTSPASDTDSFTRNEENLNKCSVNFSNIQPNHMISIKTELNDSGGLASVPVSDGKITNSSHKNAETGEGCETLKIPSPYPIFIKTELESLGSNEIEGKTPFMESSVNQWTVVGITSLPFTPITNTDPISQNAISASPTLISSLHATISPQVSSYQNEVSLRPVSPKMTILNVPLPKTLHSIKNTSSQESVTVSKIQSSKPSHIDSVNNAINTPKQNLVSEDNEWTIVGVTFASNSPQSHPVYSDRTQLASLGNDYLQNLNKLIALGSLKSQLKGENNKQSSDPSVSEAVKELSAFINKQSGSLNLNMPQPQMNDEWKVVGITQIPGHQSAPKMSESCFISQDVSSVVTSFDTDTTITTGMSNGRIKCPTLISASSSILPSTSLSSSLSSPSHISSSTVNDQLHTSTSNRAGNASILNIPSDFQANLPVSFLNSPFQQDSGHMGLSNQFQKFVGMLPGDELSQLNRTDMASYRSPLLNPANGVSACSQQPERNDANGNMCENSNFRPDKLQNNKPKFQCIEKCIGKSDCVSRKAKDMCMRCMKKHTVSHLLKMKRMKAKEQGCCVKDNHSVKEDEVERVGQNFKIMRRFSDKIVKRLTKVEREGRSRPLHSYAGNRKMFSRPLPVNKSVSLEKINLRSGTQVPVWNYESDCMEKNETFNEVSLKNEDEDTEICSNIELKKEIRSAARKRKLKVPRKMIADMDYHPFDSSSDSN